MKSSYAVIDIMPVESEVLSPAEFVELVKKNPGSIKRSSIVPGRLGSKSFGAFNVEYKYPIYKMPQSKS